MSYMNQTEFAPAAGIQELSFDEIEAVGGAGRARDVIDYGTAVAGIVGGAVSVGLAFSAGGPVGFAVGFGLGMAGVFGGSAALGSKISSDLSAKNVKKK